MNEKKYLDEKIKSVHKTFKKLNLLLNLLGLSFGFAFYGASLGLGFVSTLTSFIGLRLLNPFIHLLTLTSSVLIGYLLSSGIVFFASNFSKEKQEEKMFLKTFNKEDAETMQFSEPSKRVFNLKQRKALFENQISNNNAHNEKPINKNEKSVSKNDSSEHIF